MKDLLFFKKENIPKMDTHLSPIMYTDAFCTKQCHFEKQSRDTKKSGNLNSIALTT